MFEQFKDEAEIDNNHLVKAFNWFKTRIDDENFTFELIFDRLYGQIFSYKIEQEKKLGLIHSEEKVDLKIYGVAK